MSHQLISQVLNEYDHLSIQRGSKSRSKDNDVAFLAKGKKGNHHTKKCTDTCRNCGWDGHKAENCQEEGGGKHGQAPKHWKLRGKKSKADMKKTVQANMAATTVWLAEAIAVKEIEATMTLPFAMLTHSSIAELYDSGALQHFSPFCDQFVRFETIPPRPISTADKRTFQGVGQGDIYIEVSNGDKSTCVLLKDVLYTLSMDVTLISISKLTAAGYSALFHDSVCRIFNRYKKLVGEVEVSNGLYRVKH